jgi:uncharacterized protein (DUF433 family)
MATVAIEHIEVDEKGVARIAGSRIKVQQLVVERQTEGWTLEEIQAQHPHLTLGQIYAAFAYYFDHKAEVDAQIEDSRRYAAKMREAAGESPLVARMRAEGKLP